MRIKKISYKTNIPKPRAATFAIEQLSSSIGPFWRMNCLVIFSSSVKVALLKCISYNGQAMSPISEQLQVAMLMHTCTAIHNNPWKLDGIVRNKIYHINATVCDDNSARSAMIARSAAEELWYDRRGHEQKLQQHQKPEQLGFSSRFISLLSYWKHIQVYRLLERKTSKSFPLFQVS